MMPLASFFSGLFELSVFFCLISIKHLFCPITYFRVRQFFLSQIQPAKTQPFCFISVTGFSFRAKKSERYAKEVKNEPHTGKNRKSFDA
jgi:hypothetical protein